MDNDIIRFASHQEFREAAYDLLAEEFSDCGVDVNDAAAWKAAAIRGRVQYFEIYNTLTHEIKLKDALKEFIAARLKAFGDAAQIAHDEGMIDHCVISRSAFREIMTKIKQLEDSEQ